MHAPHRAGLAPACSGLTLIELTIVIAILAISSAMVIPSFNALIRHNQATSSANQVAGLIKYARNIAVTHSTNTTLCPSTTGQACSNTPWEQGILLFTDHNADGHIDPEDSVARYITPFIREGHLSWRSLRNKVQFNSRGAARGTIGSFVYCPTNDDPSMGASLILSLQGRLRRGPDSNGDGIPETGSHKNINC